MRIALGPRWMWWRPRAIEARADGLAIVRRAGDELVAWADLDAVIDLAPILIESRGRVLARISADDESVDDFLAIVVERAGLEWVERARKRPRMAVRPAVAASLRSGQPPGSQTGAVSARMSARGDSPDRGES